MQFLVEAYGSNGETGLKCTLCGKFGRFKHNLKRHMILKHTKPTVNICKYCNRNFDKKFYLQRHIRNNECRGYDILNAS